MFGSFTEPFNYVESAVLAEVWGLRVLLVSKSLTCTAKNQANFIQETRSERITIDRQEQAVKAREPVGERRDDKALSTAEVFVHVRELDVCDRHCAPVVVLTEVKPRLFQPLEISRRFDVQA